MTIAKSVTKNREISDNIELVKNENHIKVAKCCVSCLYKVLDNGVRMCSITKKKVHHHYVCNRWVMNENLRVAGRGDGKVKPRSYYVKKGIIADV